MVGQWRDDRVVIVGGGAAGLAAARWLSAAGVNVLLFEASHRLGGRIATDVVDGYRLDRGFQVVNTAYPALRRLVDLDTLDLRLFDHALLIADDQGRHLLADPRHHPRSLPRLPGSPVPVGGLLRLAKLSLHLGYGRPADLLAEPETTAAAYLAERLDAATRAGLVEPFLTGVFGAEPLQTSSRVLAMIWRSFVRGRIGVPAAGMGRLVESLAMGIDPAAVHLDTPVTAVGDGRVDTAGGTVRARAVIVATDPVTAGQLLPGLPVPAERVLVTTYHATDTAPLDRPVLVLDGTGRSGIANSIVITNAASGYAPPGRHLVATTAPAEAHLDEPTVRRHLARLYGVPTGDWQHLTTVQAQPGLVAAPPPRHRLRDEVALTDTLFVAGDHRDSPSLQGALVSGHRAARQVLQRLSGTAVPG